MQDETQALLEKSIVSLGDEKPSELVELLGQDERQPTLLGKVGEKSMSFGEALQSLNENGEFLLKYDENGEPIYIKASELDRILGFKAKKKMHGVKKDPNKSTKRKQAKASRKANRRK